MKLKEIARQIPQHITDTTGMLVTTHPIYAVNEVGFIRLTDELSIANRWTISEWSYLGIGYAYAKGRDLWDKAWKITKESSKKAKFLAEFSYNATANTVLVPLIYSANGETDPKVWGAGIAMCTLFSPLVGPVAGWGIDLFRKTTGIQPEGYESKYTRLNKLEELSRKARYGLAAAAVAASIGSMALIYDAVPDSWALKQETTQQNLETLIEEPVTSSR